MQIAIAQHAPLAATHVNAAHPPRAGARAAGVAGLCAIGADGRSRKPMRSQRAGGGAQLVELGERGERRGQRPGDRVVKQAPAKPAALRPLPRRAAPHARPKLRLPARMCVVVRA
jgi:hypothetical protein